MSPNKHDSVVATRDVADRVDAVRGLRSQKELAALAGLSEATISRVIRRKTQSVPVSTATALADALGFEITDLLPEAGGGEWPSDGDSAFDNERYWAPRIEHASDLLRRAEKMRRRALRGLFSRTELQWVKPEAGTTQSLLRHMRGLGEALGIIAPESEAPDETLADPHGSSAPGDVKAPILVAASFARLTLGPRGREFPEISRDTFVAFYGVIRELVTPSAPDWSLGGARPSSTPCGTSTFVTSETARLFFFVRKAMQRIARRLRAVEALRKEADDIRGSEATRLIDLAQHRGAEEARIVNAAIQELSRGWNGQLVLPEGLEAGLGFEDLVDHIKRGAVEFAHRTRGQLVLAIRDLSTSWSKGGDRPTDGYEYDVAVRDLLPTTGGRGTRARFAHRYAMHSLKVVARRLKDVRESASLTDLAVVAEEIANEATRLTDPIHAFMEARLNEAYVAFQVSNRRSLAADMALAAVCVGSKKGHWDEPVLREVTQLLLSAMDEDGNLPVGPYVRLEDEAFSRAVEATVVGAVARLAQRTPDTEIRLKIAERLVRFFEHRRVKTDGGYGWTGSLVDRDRPSPLVTATSIASLHRVVRMLESELNRLVGEATDQERAPSSQRQLIDLMSFDLGEESTLGRRASRTLLLNRLAAQLEDSRGDRACACLVVGPRGSGKSTIVRALANTGHAPLFYVTPDMERGSRAKGERLRTALSALTGAVILLDESDWTDVNSGPADGFSGALLHRLPDVIRHARRRRSVVAFVTNSPRRAELVRSTEAFDVVLETHLPDRESRRFRLYNQLERSEYGVLEPGWQDRARQMVNATHDFSIRDLRRLGWCQSEDRQLRPGSVLKYVAHGGDDPLLGFTSTRAPRANVPPTSPPQSLADIGDH